MIFAAILGVKHPLMGELPTIRMFAYNIFAKNHQWNVKVIYAKHT